MIECKVFKQPWKAVGCQKSYKTIQSISSGTVRKQGNGNKFAKS